MSATVFYYNNIAGDVGMPGVTKKLVADLSAVPGAVFFGCDFTTFFKIRANGSGGFEMVPVSPAEVGRISHGVFVAWNPPLRQLATMLRLRAGGARITCWTCGFFAKQQAETNWENGRAPLWLKRWFIAIMRMICLQVVDHFLVSGRAEAEDSRLPATKCVAGCFGRVKSAVMDALDASGAAPQPGVSNRIVFVGRGLWTKKGIGQVVRWARTAAGAAWRFVFLLTSRDARIEQEIASEQGGACEWRDDVMGAAMIPWLEEAAAVVSFSANPTQLRGLYEALYAGTPIIVSREAFMDGFREMFGAVGLEDAVQIVSREVIESGEVRLLPLAVEQRVRLGRCMRIALSPTVYADWLRDWCRAPQSPASFYEHAASLLAGETRS